ncbi:GntR family transcriptional regulator [Pseudomonas typographi]|uniref:GntR family transcriptional regulator n=1 Tax=Pseudomonas typographi TaxID=2715964 RepID=A0ABR7Z4W0_9PSED|nr:GntR family transcriptional regulator [Pseudomonas typographi]MBD1553058.1 GntR family transcriptional regulator [Pseudomonas typographi]MBD1588415.1 GntR family transcriptional regulator [Pseudomonas typographi]MBD1600510.1 GntR family transcriptional regulator [Pseudomonas typographi]
MPQLLPLSPVPLFTQLKDTLRQRILEGTYPPMSKVPSEHQLCALFSVSRITVRQALGDLQKEGLIFKIPGKGTFVAKPKAFQNVTTLQGLGESVQAQGFEVFNRVRSLRLVPASAQVAQRLRVKEGASVLQIKRVRLINREAVSLEVTYLPASLKPLLERADLASRDIFLILENDAGIALGHADLAVDAILADPELAQALAVEDGAPVMRIERLTHDTQGAPLDYEFLYYRGDAFQYRLRIDRHKGAPQ